MGQQQFQRVVAGDRKDVVRAIPHARAGPHRANGDERIYII
jgi:hypothetical protein